MPASRRVAALAHPSRARVSRAVPDAARAPTRENETISSSRARRASSPRERARAETMHRTRAAASRALSRADRGIRRRRRRDGRAREGTRAREGRKIRVARRDARRGDRTHLCERRRRTSSWEGVTSRPETGAPKSARVEIFMALKKTRVRCGSLVFPVARRVSRAAAGGPREASSTHHDALRRRNGVAIRDDVRGDVVVSPGVAISGERRRSRAENARARWRRGGGGR